MAATGFTGFFADMAAYGVGPAWVNAKPGFFADMAAYGVGLAWVNAKPHKPVYIGVTNDADLDRVTELATFHELRWTVRHKRVTKASGTYTESTVTLRAKKS